MCCHNRHSITNMWDSRRIKMFDFWSCKFRGFFVTLTDKFVPIFEPSKFGELIFSIFPLPHQYLYFVTIPDLGTHDRWQQDTCDVCDQFPISAFFRFSWRVRPLSISAICRYVAVTTWCSSRVIIVWAHNCFLVVVLLLWMGRTGHLCKTKWSFIWLISKTI